MLYLLNFTLKRPLSRLACVRASTELRHEIRHHAKERHIVIEKIIIHLVLESNGYGDGE
jgi:hypothetical protein